MLALKKSGASHKDQEFVIEFVYLTELPAAMHGRGKVELSFPSFDVPVNHLFVTVRVPTDFKYGEFTGELKEVKRFSTRPRMTPASQGGNRTDYGEPMYERYRSLKSNNRRIPAGGIGNTIHSIGHGATRSLERSERSPW